MRKLFLLHVLICSLLFSSARLFASGLSLQQAIDEVKSRTSGSIISSQTISDKQGPFHSIRVMMENGQVKNFRIPAKNDNNSRHPNPSTKLHYGD